MSSEKPFCHQDPAYFRNPCRTRTGWDFSMLYQRRDERAVSPSERCAGAWVDLRNAEEKKTKALDSRVSALLANAPRPRPAHFALVVPGDAMRTSGSSGAVPTLDGRSLGYRSDEVIDDTYLDYAYDYDDGRLVRKPDEIPLLDDDLFPRDEYDRAGWNVSGR